VKVEVADASTCGEMLDRVERDRLIDFMVLDADAISDSGLEQFARMVAPPTIVLTDSDEGKAYWATILPSVRCVDKRRPLEDFTNAIDRVVEQIACRRSRDLK